MSLSIIVLAAGKGSRMKSKKIKVLHEIANFPMLFHVLETVKSLNPRKCNIIISNEMKKMTKKVLNKFPFVKFSIQKNQLGTANAVLSGIEKETLDSKDNTLILYADTPLIRVKTLKNMIRHLTNKKSDLCILSMEPEDPKCYGRILLENNRVKKIIEFSEAKKEEINIKLCNSGVMAINSNLLKKNIGKINNKNSKGEYFLTDLVHILNDQKKVITHQKSNYNETLGVNDRNDLSEVDELFQVYLKQKILKKGVSLIKPSTIYFSYDTKIGTDSSIYPNVVIGKNVVIGSNVVIKSFCHLEDVVIKNNAEIGPFARIRASTIIEDSAKIGNFVEIKKSKVNNSTKIAHLSYIGDSNIGKNSNIGAGTITCNYDGKKKNRTIIGDNCFIGSNSSLIAPIEIKDDSIVGAGTVLKSDISSGTTVFRKSELVKKKNIIKK